MFTGIIEEIGTICSVTWGTKSAVLRIGANLILNDIKKGDSINTDGACLTVVSIERDCFSVDVTAETMRRTNLEHLKPGSLVNLERAVRLNDRLGGHLVSGHIDGTGTITGYKNEDNASWITISAKDEILKYIILKGSVAIDGISLTVAEISKTDFSVSLIPLTIKDTTLAKKNTGNLVNLECDLVGKYIERFLTWDKKAKDSTIDMNYLKKHGFA
jgi:riboflavin synthase